MSNYVDPESSWRLRYDRETVKWPAPLRGTAKLAETPLAPIEDAIATYANVAVDGPLVRTARALGVSFGDAVPVVLGEAV